MLPMLIGFSALSFFGYGLACIWSLHMKNEFARYGLARFRVVVGILQVLGAMGLLVGYAYPMITLIASVGLALQMLLGVGVRVKIRDSILQTTPAFAYFVLNGYIAFETLRLSF